MIWDLLTAFFAWVVFGVVCGFITGRRFVLGALVTVCVVLGTYFLWAHSRESVGQSMLKIFFEQSGLLVIVWLFPALLGFASGQRLWKRRTYGRPTGST
jgi:hypothetical protein